MASYGGMLSAYDGEDGLTYLIPYQLKPNDAVEMRWVAQYVIDNKTGLVVKNRFGRCHPQGRGKEG